jgi:DNA-binding SARP family transcriptional activator
MRATTYAEPTIPWGRDATIKDGEALGELVHVSVEFLGRTRVSAGQREIGLSRQNFSFLAYLVVHRDIDHPREVLIEQFWSSSDPDRARSCLGTALSRLRKTLNVGGWECLEFSARGEPRISLSAPIWFDVVAFETAVAPALATARGALVPAVLDRLINGLTHYRGDLLRGWYDNWVLAERERLRVLCLRGYRRLMEHYAAVCDCENALVAGYAALRIEPLQELVHQRVIELYHLSGQRAAAIRQYERLVVMLRSELGIGPSKATQVAIARVRAEEPPQP